MELLTRPSLLFLDEPTSGLDPGLDKSVMQTLRGLADGGRTVIVITHAVANLGLCDRVLLLAPGGTVAYFGPPDGLLPYFGMRDYSDVFEAVTADPPGVTARFTAATAHAPRATERHHDLGPPPNRCASSRGSARPPSSSGAICACSSPTARTPSSPPPSPS